MTWLKLALYQISSSLLLLDMGRCVWIGEPDNFRVFSPSKIVFLRIISLAQLVTQNFTHCLLYVLIRLLFVRLMRKIWTFFLINSWASRSLYIVSHREWLWRLCVYHYEDACCHTHNCSVFVCFTRSKWIPVLDVYRSECSTTLQSFSWWDNKV